MRQPSTKSTLVSLQLQRNSTTFAIMYPVYIKNMVCRRCVASVEQLLRRMNLPFLRVVLGEAQLNTQLTAPQKQLLEKELHQLGFELIDKRRNRLIEQIKQATRDYLNDIEKENRRKENLSDFLTKRLNYEYSYLSDLFSSVEGTTIENYFILQRIERAKELLVYDEKTLTQISYQLGFSSVHHLSSQFKKVTGLTPSHFKKIGAGKRKGADLR